MCCISGWKPRTELVALLLLVASFAGAAPPAGWREAVPDAPLRGQGSFCVLGFCLYDAQLWSARDPQGYDTPFALVLTYRRPVSRERFVDTGLDEIRRLAPVALEAAALARWRDYLARAFIDVRPGDSLCGVFLPGKGVRFYANGRLTTAIDDPVFARAFFDIWLNADTRGARLRRELLGRQE